MKELGNVDDGSTERAFIRKMRRSAIKSGFRLQFVAVYFERISSAVYL